MVFLVNQADQKQKRTTTQLRFAPSPKATDEAGSRSKPGTEAAAKLRSSPGLRGTSDPMRFDAAFSEA